MKRMVWLLACFAIAPMGTEAGELFRWVDKSGKVHYSDVLPADVTDVERKKFSSASSQGEDLPYETLRAQQNFPVTLYVTSGCGAPCNQARAMLNKRGIPFSEKSLKTQEEIDAFYKTSGSSGAPTLAIGKNYLSGFQEAKWNSELDVAGYPKTASYRQRATAPVPSATPPAAENQGAPGAPAVQ
jgi:glutaredoxin